ncbi:MAG TPA: ribonuclease H-like domain-containing protein, partial [Firmicutes bacterium]|nr:ribonuclease H-like domain-containing protein [Bacillota bacterium]
MSGNLRLRLQRYKQSGELGGAPGGPADPFRTDPLFPGEGTELDTPAGRCYVRELYLPLNYLHGPGPLSELLVLNGPGWELPAKDKRLQEVNPAGSLFVDIETTGLAGGSGTWAFLIGTGWFELTCFRLRQYFLRRLPEEKAMIHHFTQAASNYPSLVTFNGKAFDLPIIWNRQILTRAPGLTKPLYHVDLLHCARRLYKQRLSSCNLRSLEESLLCFQRQGDIPGEEIPAVYFNYLRRGETARLIEVFKHNALDILSMVSLLCRILKTVSEQQIDHPADYLALGNLYLETGQVDKA